MGLWVSPMYLGYGMWKRLSTDSPLDCVFFSLMHSFHVGVARNAFHSLFELELLLPGSKVFFFLSSGGIHSPVAPDAVGWCIGNTVFGTLHI